MLRRGRLKDDDVVVGWIGCGFGWAGGGGTAKEDGVILEDWEVDVLFDTGTGVFHILLEFILIFRDIRLELNISFA